MNSEPLDPISDEILMSRVSKDDLDSLVPLFDRYHRKLYNFFLKLAFDRASSEDLVQNLFMRLIKYRHSFDPSRSFRAWIYQMARNVFYDHYGREIRKQTNYVGLEDIAGHVDSAHEDQEALRREEQLHAAMEQLSADKRELLVMSKFQGLPYEEIATITQTTVSNVKVRVHRAIATLRTIYFQNNQS